MPWPPCCRRGPPEGRALRAPPWCWGRPCRTSSVAWISLVQLAVGMVVLVWYKANLGASDCSLGSNSSVGQASGSSANETLAEAERAAFVGGIAALAGVVLTS